MNVSGILGMDDSMKIVIFIPAYEAEKTLEDVVRRIPREIYESVTDILIQDDGSQDSTFQIALRLAKEFEKITVVKNKINLGYGGTKKKAYRYCINKGYDAVVMVHGDGQLPPENLPEMLEPLLSGKADIVLGSRILGDPLKGGMPIYKWLGNRFLTFLTNLVFGLSITDYHTGYRAYLCESLKKTEFWTCSDGHEISSELLIRAANKKLRITEVAASTYYGPGSRSCSFRTSTIYGLNVIKMLFSPKMSLQGKPELPSDSKCPLEK